MTDEQKVRFLIEIQALITRREGYLAENQQRVVTGNWVAYGADQFFELEQQFQSLLERTYRE